MFKYLLISAIPFKLSYLYPFPFQVGEKIPVALWIYPFVILFIGYMWYTWTQKAIIGAARCFSYYICCRCFMWFRYPATLLWLTAILCIYRILRLQLGFPYCHIIYTNAKRKWILYAGFLYCSYLCVYTASYAPAWKNSDTLKEHFKEVLKKRETNLSINFKHEKQWKEQNRSISRNGFTNGRNYFKRAWRA